MADHQGGTLPPDYEDRLLARLEGRLKGKPPPREPMPWMGPDDTRRDWLADKSREDLAKLDALIRIGGPLAAFIALFDAEDLDDLKRLLKLGRSTLHILRFLKAAVIVVAAVVGGTVVFAQNLGAIGSWFAGIIRAIAGAKT